MAFENLAKKHGWTVTHKSASNIYVIEKGFRSVIAYPTSDKFRFNHKVCVGLIEFIRGNNEQFKIQVER